MRWVHGLLLLAGAGGLVFLVGQAGPGELWNQAAALGWATVIIVALEGPAELLRALGWQLCFHPDHRPGWSILWGAHLAGNAINLATPTATIGGEVVRGTLLPRGVPGTESAASVTINKLTAALGDTSFGLAGVVVLLASVPLGTGVRAAAIGTAALLSAGVIAFLFIQRTGRLASWVGSHPLLRRLASAALADRVAEAAAEIDGRIAAFHRDRTPFLLGSVVLHAGSNIIGIAQVAVFLYWVGIPADLTAATNVFLISTALDLAAFFVPARLGTQEVARMLAMSLMGFDAKLGLLLSLVLRVQQVAWIIVGLLLYPLLASGRARGAKALEIVAPGGRPEGAAGE